MKQGISTEIRQLAIVVGCGTLFGAYIGFPWWAASIAAMGYFAWSLLQLQKLLRWLELNPEHIPPTSTGVWNTLFERFYKIQLANINARRRLNITLNRMRDSTAALRDAVILLDNKQRITWWNTAAQTFLGLQKGVDEGQQITNLIRDPAFIEYFSSGEFEDPLQLESPANSALHLELTITLFGEGEYLIFARDITRLHNLEQMRQDFVANVSHELRTPLTVITGYLETLLELGNQSNGKNIQNMLHEMQKQTSRMNALVEDLLLLSRLGTTPVHYAETPLDITSMLETIQKDAEQLSAEKAHQISLHIDSEAGLQGNEQELHSAFTNLIANAVKYTPAHGKIKMHWWQDAQGRHLSVSDNGIGIEPRHIPRLTERFYRVDKSRSLATGGTGLGLAIVKHVLLRHNGYLEIKSEPGVGSSFTCHFPER